jgi:hypothetical protein
MIHYPFSIMVWKKSLQDIFPRVHWPFSTQKLLFKWKYYYLDHFQNKEALKRIWFSLPKYICWKIWIARNKSIFQGENYNPDIVADMVFSLLIQYINMILKLKHLNQSLDKREAVWFNAFSLSSGASNSLIPRPHWQLHITESNFSQWKKE